MSDFVEPAPQRRPNLDRPEIISTLIAAAVAILGFMLIFAIFVVNGIFNWFASWQINPYGYTNTVLIAAAAAWVLSFVLQVASAERSAARRRCYEAMRLETIDNPQ